MLRPDAGFLKSCGCRIRSSILSVPYLEMICGFLKISWKSIVFAKVELVTRMRFHVKWYALSSKY